MSNKSSVQNARNRNISISLITLVSITILIFIYLQFASNRNASKLSVSFVYIIARYAFLGLAAVFFLLRLLTNLVQKDNLILIFTAIANMAIGISAVIMYFTDQSDIQWLHQCLINLLIGFLLLVTAYIPFK